MFLDSTYFNNELAMPNLKSIKLSGVAEVLETVGNQSLYWYIEKYERQYLIDLLGYELYARMIDELEGMEESEEPVKNAWTDLRDMIFVKSGNYNFSPAANYVYFYANRSGQTQTSMNGEVRARQDNASIVSADYKLVKAWNDMVDMSERIRKYLYANKNVYGEIKGAREWRYINSFGI